MKQLHQNLRRCSPRVQAGMTLVEVIVAMAVAGLVVGGMIGGYLFCIISAEKSALSLAANAQALERLEETRAGKWDTASYPPVDQLVATNFPAQVVLLDRAGSRVAATYATNLVEITQISTNPPLKRIRVDCIWSFHGGQRITNTIETCRAPDQ